ncbi:MAG: radical SAM protein [Deltaproteobacteria bacterium]|nr:MAG: radical SAM protein [Deltaproteobacteria bacterium]
MQHPKTTPCLVFADKNGNISEFPELAMVGMGNGRFYRPRFCELIPLPEGSELFCLPDRLPVGWSETDDQPMLLAEHPYRQGEPLQAVAAFIAPAHTSLYSCGYQSVSGAQRLPLFAYTAVGWAEGRFWVTAFRSDPDNRQDCNQYSRQTVYKKTQKRLRQSPDNRLIQHLGKCCLTYGCPAARNFFLNRWEAPLPTSPTCNARCIGCISLQESQCCPATQERIPFVPRIGEITEIAIGHLRQAARAIVSFGQGCEGEPLLQATTIEKAIIAIRKKTLRGTINLNSNASRPEQVNRLAKAGLDSIRVSLNSAQEKYYNRYYRQRSYSFADVLQSIDTMKRHNKFVSLNYFVFPGFTDSEPEFEALCHLLDKHRPDFIQLRNFNMDPEEYTKVLQLPDTTRYLGVQTVVEKLKNRFPALGLGYFNPQLNPKD